MVGAGAVVIRDVPPHALVVGNPARMVGLVCRCGARLGVDRVTISCAECGTGYDREGEGAVERSS
jgi:UDP-2-acetamido-3-amino-2,3-dideoxy-glucuronate N-acetyltransferase